ncbi:hypothetical protein SUBVAR_04411 [Subdoligranulum variabile DSM 15176]|uniref:Uncharacterized protein n=1 Tax=Subdoligranulum variabile DSM 15176 TaxID=411471 RepID=D1PJ90_9FIRM|nr:hypothetical protein SUBVAR_04411 [Subdoligranulum variabile DSM 15176]
MVIDSIRHSFCFLFVVSRPPEGSLRCLFSMIPYAAPFCIRYRRFSPAFYDRDF